MHFERYFSLFQMRDFKAKEGLKTKRKKKRYVKQKKELIQCLQD